MTKYSIYNKLLRRKIGYLDFQYLSNSPGKKNHEIKIHGGDELIDQLLKIIENYFEETNRCVVSSTMSHRKHLNYKNVRVTSKIKMYRKFHNPRTQKVEFIPIIEVKGGNKVR